MTNRSPILAVLTVLAVTAAIAGCGSRTPAASAVVARSGAISVLDPFIPVPTSSLAAFYVTLRNSGSTADALVGATSPVAQSASLHTETVIAGGAETMTDLALLALPAHGQAGLVPGHDHLMLAGLHRTLVAGQRVAVTLHFAHSAAVTVEAPVVPLSQVADGMGDESANMGNMNMAGQ